MEMLPPLFPSPVFLIHCPAQHRAIPSPRVGISVDLAPANMDHFAGHTVHYQGCSDLKQLLKLPTDLSLEEKWVTSNSPQNLAVQCCGAGLWEPTWATSLSQPVCCWLQRPRCSQGLNRIILLLANTHHHASPLPPWLGGKAWLALKICP